MAWDAQILLLGVSHSSNTTFEAVEEELAPEYVGFIELPNARIVDEQGTERPVPTSAHNMACSADFNRMNAPLIRAGAQSEIVIGEAIVRRVSAAGLYRVARQAIEADDYALRLREGEDRLPTPATSIHDLP
jgi:aminoglycoside N3'-acetyltransferase